MPGERFLEGGSRGRGSGVSGGLGAVERLSLRHIGMTTADFQCAWLGPRRLFEWHVEPGSSAPHLQNEKAGAHLLQRGMDRLASPGALLIFTLPSGFQRSSIGWLDIFSASGDEDPALPGSGAGGDRQIGSRHLVWQRSRRPGDSSRDRNRGTLHTLGTAVWRAPDSFRQAFPSRISDA